MKKPKYPKQLLVYVRNRGGDNEYLDTVSSEAELATDRFQDGDVIAVYDLKVLKRLSKPVELR